MRSLAKPLTAIRRFMPLLEGTPPDICLLDIYMPGGGIEAAAIISAGASSTSVVMLTVSNSNDDVLAALRAGAVGYLPKDISPDRLPVALAAS